MKKFIQLGMLTALACVSAQATTVTWNSTVSSTSSISATSGSDSVAATGYVLFAGNYTLMSVQSNGSGVGVDSTAAGALTSGQVATTTDGQYAEYLVLNFGGTVNGQAIVDSIVMNFTGTANTPYFRYAWSSVAPTSQISDGSFTTVSSMTGSGPYTASSLSGSGRYLVINPLTSGGANSFQVASVTYTSVPDGASTLALMGAALATLGFAARRRKA
jgi:hypothetical protein